MALSGELGGDRPSLTPRHSGTIWTTCQVLPSVRLGGGQNARSLQTPNRNPVGIVAPSFVTGDVMAEFTLNESVGETDPAVIGLNGTHHNLLRLWADV